MQNVTRRECLCIALLASGGAIVAPLAIARRNPPSCRLFARCHR